MVRIGLSLYLMFSAAVSPCFCCCTGERLAALFAPSGRQAAHSGCCGHHQDATGLRSHGTPKQHPGKQHQPGHPSCPCKEDGRQQIPLASLNSEFAKQLESRQFDQGPIEVLPDFLTAICLSSEGNAHPSDESVALPFVTAQDILRALHILRC